MASVTTGSNVCPSEIKSQRVIDSVVHLVSHAFTSNAVSKVSTTVYTDDLVRRPSASGTSLTTPSMASSKLGKASTESG
ncbi:MAG: hypothetical protein LGB01_00365 [Sulfurovum sp.]|nr:hypothetical protein [Sulfurovum sp.]